MLLKLNNKLSYYTGSIKSFYSCRHQMSNLRRPSKQLHMRSLNNLKKLLDKHINNFSVAHAS